MSSMTDCPFKKGRSYRVNRAISELGHNFEVGELVRFQDHSYDAKLGVIRFWFQTPASETKAWQVWDSEMESLNRWREKFAETPN